MQLKNKLAQPAQFLLFLCLFFPLSLIFIIMSLPRPHFGFAHQICGVPHTKTENSINYYNFEKVLSLSDAHKMQSDMSK